jgi:hypothetical protein
VTVTTATFSVAGDYVLRLTASDSDLTGSAEISITVDPENQAPAVNAGADQTNDHGDVRPGRPPCITPHGD